MTHRVCVVLMVLGVLAFGGVARAQEVGERSLDVELVPTLLWQSQLVSSQEELSGAREEIVPRLRFRRLRPGLELSLWEDRARAELVVSVLPGDLELVEAHIALDLGEAHMVRVGQFKIPFMRYRMNSGTRLVLVDWSFHTEYIGGERQVGVAFGNDERASGVFRYEVGLFTGQNARNSHGVGIARFYDSPTREPAALVDAERVPYEGFSRPEIAAHLGWALGGIDPSTLDDLERKDRLRAYVGVGATLNLVPRGFVEHALRVGVEGMLKWRGVGIYTGAYHAVNSEYHFTDSIDPLLGYSGVIYSMSYRFKALPLSVGARTSWIKLDEQFFTDVFIREQSGGEPGSGLLKSLREHTAGGRWDLYGDMVSLGADVGINGRKVRSSSATTGLPEDTIQRGWLARLQLQLRL